MADLDAGGVEAGIQRQILDAERELASEAAAEAELAGSAACDAGQLRVQRELVGELRQQLAGLQYLAAGFQQLADLGSRSRAAGGEPAPAVALADRGRQLTAARDRDAQKRAELSDMQLELAQLQACMDACAADEGRPHGAGAGGL